MRFSPSVSYKTILLMPDFRTAELKLMSSPTRHCVSLKSVASRSATIDYVSVLMHSRQRSGRVVNIAPGMCQIIFRRDQELSEAGVQILSDFAGLFRCVGPEICACSSSLIA